MNVLSSLPKNSIIIFRRTLFKQDFKQEFYTINMPYDSGTLDEKIYSFENKIANTEYLLIKLTSQISAGSKNFIFKKMRNSAANSLTTGYNVQMFNLQKMVLDEFLGNMPTLLTTGGITHIDNLPVDPQVNPTTFFTKGKFKLELFIEY